VGWRMVSWPAPLVTVRETLRKSIIWILAEHARMSGHHGGTIWDPGRTAQLRTYR
jgi:hypothetical protein